MREKKTFAQRTRTRNTDEVRRKYFLVYEGKETEEIYFEGVSQNRSMIGINPLIELVPVVRSYSEEGWSNPKKIVDRMLLNLEETCKMLAEYFQDKEGYEQIVDDVPRIIRNRAITYAEGFDKICFVVDRDRESFVAHEDNNQYEYVLKKCRENGLGFYLTNPCFEFWLLLHFDDVEQLDEIKLFNNPKITAKRRYTEQELRKRMTGYTKSSYDVDWFMNRIHIAIQNEKTYCEDIEKLEYSVGSRVGLLIEELKDK